VFDAMRKSRTITDATIWMMATTFIELAGGKADEVTGDKFGHGCAPDLAPISLRCAFGMKA
jgi:hypothetical protein